jgi:copper chaperone CopZ
MTKFNKMENKEILRKLRSVELCMTAHPDYEKGSEFEDRIVDLQEIQQALILPDVIVPKGTFCEFCKEVPTKEQGMLCSKCLIDIQNC